MYSTNLSESATADIRIKLPKKIAKVIEDALLPEVLRPASDRSKTNVWIENSKLVININSSDVVALRAALNSYLHLVSGMLNIVEKI